jgi:pyruvate/2-oxoglutarate/acetoin dehydrogenase E1 component
MYAGTVSDTVPKEFATPAIYDDAPEPKVTAEGMLQKDALREAMIEEMERDSRVLFYGEDVADYGGAFKASKGLMERFGRDRVFNTPISEAAIIGTGVGAAMAGLRPVVELMYMDFALMASDQIANQAGKWHFMSGGQTTVPMVIRCSVGAGKGYGGQHSQSLESLFTHLPGLVVAYPATAADAKGMLKSAIRSDDPVLFCESQGLYVSRGPVPEGDHLVPLGKSAHIRDGSDATIVAWGPAVPDALKAAAALAGEGIECDVIDLRTLVPLDMEPVLASVARTGRCVVAAQAILSGSYVNEIVARVVSEAFDDLDAPVARIGAANGISPQAEGLEAAFLPNADDIANAVRGLI